GPVAVVETRHVSRAVVAGRDRAGEIGIVERVVLHFDGQAADGGIEAGPLGDRPALQAVTHLQTQVVMAPPRMMQLHHEPGTPRSAFPALWFPRPAEVALACVVGEIGHLASAHTCPPIDGTAAPAPYNRHRAAGRGQWPRTGQGRARPPVVAALSGACFPRPCAWFRAAAAAVWWSSCC